MQKWQQRKRIGLQHWTPKEQFLKDWWKVFTVKLWGSATLSIILIIWMEILWVFLLSYACTISWIINKRQRLTTGPGLPVRPIGPGDPLIASCRHTQQTHFTHYIIHSNMRCYITCLSFILYIIYFNRYYLYIIYFIACLQVHDLCWI